MNYIIHFFVLLSNLKKILLFHHICTLIRELNVAAQGCRISTPALLLLMSYSQHHCKGMEEIKVRYVGVPLE